MNFRLETMIKTHTTQDLITLIRSEVITAFYSTGQQLRIQQQQKGMYDD